MGTFFIVSISVNNCNRDDGVKDTAHRTLRSSVSSEEVSERANRREPVDPPRGHTTEPIRSRRFRTT